ncbi:hypothetical protein GCM10011492_27150 [Flexivirga endophytica]|uniref:Uncharacterized protein n=1 Tax=Flexivirga endophytica TaxID=1849103 RepID=A0A916WW19_9MICO|nr:hypothetical protein GCM10011492_27150 [Flexivirga endophytica]GHB42898.1 hypothetical protein GCM10008112_09530 [Flexivirga endophytica]
MEQWPTETRSTGPDWTVLARRPRLGTEVQRAIRTRTGAACRRVTEPRHHGNHRAEQTERGL